LTAQMAEAAPPARRYLLRMPVDSLSMSATVERLRKWLDSTGVHVVSLVTAHTIMACRRQPEMFSAFEDSDLSAPDGMPLVWWLRWLGFADVDRVYGPDLMLETCAMAAEEGVSVYFYGGAPGVGEKLTAALCARLPSLQVAGWHSPPFRPLTPEELERDIDRINRSKAKILWVGLGSLYQERWIRKARRTLRVPATVGVGAAFDFLSGAKPQAPPWMRNIGLEWFFRLLTEPRRLWRRYIEYPWFALLALSDVTRNPSGKKPGGTLSGG
jgi:N-acetylglucosaminyldiphosphoundecaprenol N-acetyl-beta-D-mannosaminyltransferase